MTIMTSFASSSTHGWSCTKSVISSHVLSTSFDGPQGTFVILGKWRWGTTYG